jgi:hypothetical protein
MTDSEKLAKFDRIAEIIDEHLKFMEYQQGTHESFENVEFAKVDAYRKIVLTVTGEDLLVREMAARMSASQHHASRGSR